MMDWNEAEKFFLEASAATYAAGATPTTIPTLPGSKVLAYELPPFRYVDLYFNSAIGESWGTTLLYHEDFLPRPVWRLSYGGWYDRGDDRVTAFLRLALSAGYHSGEFIGGRGPRVFTAPEFPGLIYYNHVTGGSFIKPHGRDAIVVEHVHSSDRERYWHDYHGGNLIPVD